MMRLLRKTRESNGRELKEPTALLAELEQRSDFLVLTTRALLQLLSDYVLDLQEIKGAEIKEKLPELSEQLVSLDNRRRLQTAFDKAHREISDHARLQRQYLLDREAELKDVIDVLTKAMVELDSDNRRYNDNLLSRSDRMREITLLEDIRKIKASLTGELDGIRATIKEKQTRDQKKLELLSRQVRNLYGELEKARHDSQRDSLTGAYNRAAFDHYVAELLQRNAVSERPFALLLIDIDDFKAINDTYGHQTGDRVIIAVITKCRSSIRKEDFLARYGGEEFVLVLPDATVRNGVKKAKQVLKAVASARYALEGFRAGESISVTVSIGVSGYRRGDTAATIVERADGALYKAKQSGKNCAFSETDL